MPSRAASTSTHRLGELIRRITGLTPGAYFRAAVAVERGVRTWIGVPREELGGLARLSEAPGRPPMPGPETLIMRMVTMNGAFAFPGLDEPHGWNDPALLTAEIPGAGAASSPPSATPSARAVRAPPRHCRRRPAATAAVRRQSESAPARAARP
ncbi:hypothetical protein Aau02nite_45490 [Amorphoplanes auranticolor]|uniref:Uncharacterized protein n=1 Tax=Actinoplanes auranticolor TaxID=47988 RepID=A0A919VPY2_9ACTN|nr:hypothetical protein Aau02nite_45490 [Actinoplanes auranticolor]